MTATLRLSSDTTERSRVCLVAIWPVSMLNDSQRLYFIGFPVLLG